MIGDTGNERVRRVAAGGRITTVAGGGPAAPTDGTLATAVHLVPFAVALTADGGYAMIDGPSHKVSFVDAGHMSVP